MNFLIGLDRFLESLWMTAIKFFPQRMPRADRLFSQQTSNGLCCLLDQSIRLMIFDRLDHRSFGTTNLSSYAGTAELINALGDRAYR